MFDEFSAGYYVGQLYIEPHDGEHAVMDRVQHEEANEQVYAADEGIERVDYPLVMKWAQATSPSSGTMTYLRTRSPCPTARSRRPPWRTRRH